MMVVRLESRVRPAGTGTSSNSLRCARAGPEDDAHDASPRTRAHSRRTRAMGTPFPVESKLCAAPGSAGNGPSSNHGRGGVVQARVRLTPSTGTFVVWADDEPAAPGPGAA